ncbi:DUF58 domain-containing protein [Candidatus Omnitrophota bacterium]
MTRHMHEIAYEDDMLNVKMDIQNKRRLASYFFEVVDRFPGGEPGKEKPSLFVLDLGSRENKKTSYMVNCYKRGLWRFGPISIISQDALGFFKMKKTLKVFSDILVYPNLFKIFAFPSLLSGSVSWMGVETAKISGDNHEFFGVREYQRGDAMSRIHWPSSARHDKLIVKQFERNAIKEATIVLDLNKKHNVGSGKETTLEYAVKIAGSISRYLLSEGVFVQVAGYGKERASLPSDRGESHMHRILEYLARVHADGDLPLSQALEEASFITPHRSTLIVTLLDNDIESLASLVQFKVNEIKPIIIVLSTSTFGQMEERRGLDVDQAEKFDEALAGLEAYVYKISKGDDLQKKFETV